MPTILILLLYSLSFSSYAVEPYSCRNGHFPTYDGIHLAEITGNTNEKVHAREDSDGCPEPESCKRKGYLIKGDKVLATTPSDGWVCIYYLGKKNDYVGWVKQQEIRDVDVPVLPKLDGWLGKWESIGAVNLIQIRPGKSGQLQVFGKARWLGGKNSYGEAIVHFGQVHGEAHPEANKLVITENNPDQSCVVNLNLIDAFIVATDNEKCGGMNVRFNGVYRQKPLLC